MDFNFIVAHLRNFFESPPQRFLARQALATCQQGPVESSAAFANRLLNLVRAATVGQDPITQRERVLEEYVARLRGDVRYFVRLDNPSTFEQAVSRAQMVEQLLAEATADKQMHPSSHSINQGVQALPTQVLNQRCVFASQPKHLDAARHLETTIQWEMVFGAIPAVVKDTCLDNALPLALQLRHQVRVHLLHPHRVSLRHLLQKYFRLRARPP